MPSLSKIASYHSVALAPRHKAGWYPAATPRHDRPGVADPDQPGTVGHHQPAGQSVPSAVPSLPDVPQSSRAQAPQQRSFLHALLAQDEEERNDDPGNGVLCEPRNNNSALDSGRNAGTEPVELAHQGDNMFSPEDETDRAVTVVARSSASNTKSGQPRRSGGRRLSRESGSSLRQPPGSWSGSGSGSSKTIEYRHRLSRSGGDAKRSVFRKPSSPSAVTRATRAEKHSAGSFDISNRSKQQRRPSDSAVDTRCENHTVPDGQNSRGGVTDTTLPPTLISVSARPGAAETPKPSAVDAGVGDETPAAASHLTNQWTSCRALEDLGDEDDDAVDAQKTDDEVVGQPEFSDAWSQEAPRVGEGFQADGVFSRAASSTNLARRKRPLLLPPIMLPPIYTVKPTPLRLRDEVYFMGASPRAHRPVSDEEWENLKDCRYLRIRTLKRSLRV